MKCVLFLTSSAQFIRSIFHDALTLPHTVLIPTTSLRPPAAADQDPSILCLRSHHSEPVSGSDTRSGWWLRPAISLLRKQRQKGQQEVEASLMDTHIHDLQPDGQGLPSKIISQTKQSQIQFAEARSEALTLASVSRLPGVFSTVTCCDK